MWLRGEQGLDITSCTRSFAFLRSHELTRDLFANLALRIDEVATTSVGEQIVERGSTRDVGVAMPLWPIPSGDYPPLRGFPEFALEFQLQERRRIEAEIAARESVKIAAVEVSGFNALSRQ